MAKTTKLAVKRTPKVQEEAAVPPAKEKTSLREKISSQLETIFTDLKTAIGEKKFAKNIKKASKALIAGAGKKKPVADKKKAAPKKAAKKQ